MKATFPAIWLVIYTKFREISIAMHKYLSTQPFQKAGQTSRGIGFNKYTSDKNALLYSVLFLKVAFLWL